MKIEMKQFILWDEKERLQLLDIVTQKIHNKA